MKRIILLCVFTFTVCAGFSQEIPADIQQRLDELQAQFRLSLDSIRTNPDLVNWSIDALLSRWFPLEQRNRIDSLGLELHLGMVYDEPMRERLIQLLNNEFREGELEILVDRAMARITTFDQRAMWAMGVFETREFRQVQDSLNRHRDREVRERLYSNPEVFRYLRYDTLAIFRQTMDSVKKQAREDLRIHFLNEREIARTAMITSAAGRIGDERFVEPLRNALRYWGEFRAIRDALVRMKVEPYYSEFMEEYTFSMGEIQEMEFVVDLHRYVDIVRTQASFREVSKFLHSNAYVEISSRTGPFGNGWEEALGVIRRNIENEDLHRMINDPAFDRERDILKVYDWMQENYGNYIIRRVW